MNSYNSLNSCREITIVINFGGRIFSGVGGLIMVCRLVFFILRGEVFVNVYHLKASGEANFAKYSNSEQKLYYKYIINHKNQITSYTFGLAGLLTEVWAQRYYHPLQFIRPSGNSHREIAEVKVLVEGIIFLELGNLAELILMDNKKQHVSAKQKYYQSAIEWMNYYINDKTCTA